MGDWLPPLILACFSPPIEVGVISHLIYRIQSLFPYRANFLSGLTSYIAIVYLTIQKSKIYMYCLYNSRMLRHSCCEVRVMQLHDILQLRTSVILPEAISDGGLALTTDTSLFLTIYRGGGHLPSDISCLLTVFSAVPVERT